MDRRGHAAHSSRPVCETPTGHKPSKGDGKPILASSNGSGPLRGSVAESSPWPVKPALGYKAPRLGPDADPLMNPFWSQMARELSPYVPGEQPRIANLVKLNTNESPFGPSPLALETMRAAAVATLRFIRIPRRRSCVRCLPFITA